MGTLVYVEVTTNTKSSKKNDVLEQRMLRSCNSAQPKKNALVNRWIKDIVKSSTAIKKPRDAYEKDVSCIWRIKNYF